MPSEQHLDSNPSARRRATAGPTALERCPCPRRSALGAGHQRRELGGPRDPAWFRGAYRLSTCRPAEAGRSLSELIWRMLLPEANAALPDWTACTRGLSKGRERRRPGVRYLSFGVLAFDRAPAMGRSRMRAREHTSPVLLEAVRRTAFKSLTGLRLRARADRGLLTCATAPEFRSSTAREIARTGRAPDAV